MIIIFSPSPFVGGNMLKMIIRAMKAAIRWLLRLPAGILNGLAGPQYMSPPADDFDEAVEDEADGLWDAIGGRTESLMPETKDIGRLVHSYAAGDDAFRAMFDVSKIPQQAAASLIVMDRDQFEKLASAGPDICGRWAMGMKTGLVGVPHVPKLAAVSSRRPAVEQESRFKHRPEALRRVSAPFALAA
jgi:hypothetical protein